MAASAKLTNSLQQSSNLSKISFVGEYIDRAQSGKFGNRADFQRMIADSDKHTFECVNHFTIIINASKKPLSIDNIPLDEIEEAFEGETEGKEGCSSMTTPAPPLIITSVVIL